MATLVPGKLAPGFTLKTVGGKAVSLADLLQQGSVVLAFFKVSCPVCQYAFPLYERLYQAHRGAKAAFLGISQDNLRQTQSFLKEFGVSFPVALDEEGQNYPASNAYGLTNVPTLFYIAPDREIEISSVGWSREEVEAVNAKLAALGALPPPLLWREGDDIRDVRPG